MTNANKPISDKQAFARVAKCAAFEAAWARLAPHLELTQVSSGPGWSGYEVRYDAIAHAYIHFPHGDYTVHLSIPDAKGVYTMDDGYQLTTRQQSPVNMVVDLVQRLAAHEYKLRNEAARWTRLRDLFNVVELKVQNIKL
jgi:hypothetical protein